MQDSPRNQAVCASAGGTVERGEIRGPAPPGQITGQHPDESPGKRGMLAPPAFLRDDRGIEDRGDGLRDSARTGAQELLDRAGNADLQPERAIGIGWVKR